MTVTISGSSGVTYPAGGTANTAGAGVGTTDTQTLTNKTLTNPTITGATFSGTISGGTFSNSSITAANSNTVEATSGPTSTQLAGMRNKIINGAMQVWQRGTSGFTTLNTHVYAADRFFGFSGVGTAGTFSQVASTGLTGFPYAMRGQRNAGNTATTGVVIGQTIESINCYSLAGSSVTLSFWARAGANYSAASNLLNAYITTGTGVDQGTLSWINSSWTGQAFISLGTATLTTSWQKFTFTTSIPANVTELAVYVQENALGTAGANDYYDITGVQLEPGATATPFENRLYGEELMLCQRYYNQIPSATLSGATFYNGPNIALVNISLPVTPRATPSVSYTNTLYVLGNATSIAVSGTPASITLNSPAYVQFMVTATGIVANTTYWFYTSSGALVISAEL